MATSNVEICNNALDMVGANNISSLYENSKEAKVALRQYDISRKAILRMFPWAFAMKRSTITELGETPEFDYDYRLILPSDFLRLNYADLDPYRFEGWQNYPTIVCNATEANVKYTANITDTDQFDPLFDEALAAYLAWKMSYKLSQSDVNRDELYKAFYNLCRQAKHTGSVENVPGSVETNEWIESRINPVERFVRDPMT
jgi:hypothetical protein